MTARAVEDAARLVVLRYAGLADANGRTYLDAVLAVDCAVHDLAIVLGCCPFCEPGTCPGELDRMAGRVVRDTAPL
jgi:hypothetical protein